MVDFVGKITHSGLVNALANKGVILNARILWTFSAAYRFNRSERTEQLAERAFGYLQSYFWDKENGGLLGGVDCLGKPVKSVNKLMLLGLVFMLFQNIFEPQGVKRVCNLQSIFMIYWNGIFLMKNLAGTLKYLTRVGI